MPRALKVALLAKVRPTLTDESRAATRDADGVWRLAVPIFRKHSPILDRLRMRGQRRRCPPSPERLLSLYFSHHFCPFVSLMSISFLFLSAASQPRMFSLCVFVPPTSKFSSEGDPSNAALAKQILKCIFYS